MENGRLRCRHDKSLAAGMCSTRSRRLCEFGQDAHHLVLVVFVQIDCRPPLAQHCASEPIWSLFRGKMDYCHRAVDIGPTAASPQRFFVPSRVHAAAGSDRFEQMQLPSCLTKIVTAQTDIFPPADKRCGASPTNHERQRRSMSMRSRSRSLLIEIFHKHCDTCHFQCTPNVAAVK